MPKAILDLKLSGIRMGIRDIQQKKELLDNYIENEGGFIGGGSANKIGTTDMTAVSEHAVIVGGKNNVIGTAITNVTCSNSAILGGEGNITFKDDIIPNVISDDED